MKLIHWLLKEKKKVQSFVFAIISKVGNLVDRMERDAFDVALILRKLITHQQIDSSRQNCDFIVLSINLDLLSYYDLNS